MGKKSNQYKTEIKQTIIQQALFDLGKQQKSNFNSFISKINKLTTEFTIKQHPLMKNTLPRQNMGYIIVGIIHFFEKGENIFFNYTLSQYPNLICRNIRDN